MNKEFIPHEQKRLSGQLETFMKTRKPASNEPITLDEFFEKRSQ